MSDGGSATEVGLGGYVSSIFSRIAFIICSSLRCVTRKDVRNWGGGGGFLERHHLLLCHIIAYFITFCHPLVAYVIARGT